MNHEWITYKSSDDNVFFERLSGIGDYYWIYHRCKNCKLYWAAIKDNFRNKYQGGYFMKWNGGIIFNENDKIPSCGEIMMISVME